MFQRLYLFPWPEVFQGQGQTGRSLGRRELTYVTVTLKEIEIEFSGLTDAHNWTFLLMK